MKFDELAAAMAILDQGMDFASPRRPRSHSPRTNDRRIAQVMRSPKQLEIRAKARSLSLVRSENARAPVLGRDEIVQSFAKAFEALGGGQV